MAASAAGCGQFVLIARKKNRKLWSLYIRAVCRKGDLEHPSRGKVWNGRALEESGDRNITDDQDYARSRSYRVAYSPMTYA